ncbi:hypothetical protein [Granulicella arctica]|uniref:Uncharacterized protein n=1 Tax=Granulicella arctica TaxID=940613 RepID=A0A7Y9PGP5_9BACT|nr:hypothetical protein [Granulicella arctica]NYF78813.1 hypothetical protein [Granulicella arctica]
MKLFSSQRFLAIYSGVLTAVFAATVLTAFKKPLQNATFDEITVHRINVVEPDGTPRLIVSNKASFPGAYIHGKDIPRTDRNTAGMIFINDEGTENGGLIFGGLKDAQGEHSYGHLSFDRYDQDQALNLEQNQDGERRNSGLSINDTQGYPIPAQMIADAQSFESMPDGPGRAQALKELMAKYPPYVRRAYFGRSVDHSVGLTLRDEQGRERLRVAVKADGSPAIELLDESGKVVNELTSETKGRSR